MTIDDSKMTEANAKKFEKMATYKFLQACIQELEFPPEERPIIGDLYGDDTTGFVKVQLNADIDSFVLINPPRFSMW